MLARSVSPVYKALARPHSVFFTRLPDRQRAIRNFPRTMTTSYPQRKIGDDAVSAQGLGCMGMSFSYTSFGGFDNEQSLQVLTKAADLGITLWDTSDVRQLVRLRSSLRSLLTLRNPGVRSAHERAAHRQMVQGDGPEKRHLPMLQVRQSAHQRAASRARRSRVRKGSMQRQPGETRYRPHRSILRPSHRQPSTNREDSPGNGRPQE